MKRRWIWSGAGEGWAGEGDGMNGKAGGNGKEEREAGRGGEVWRRGTARLVWGCIKVGTGVAGREYGVKKWMDIEFIIRYFKKKS